jgi:hypothetical protein
VNFGFWGYILQFSFHFDIYNSFPGLQNEEERTGPLSHFPEDQAQHAWPEQARLPTCADFGMICAAFPLILCRFCQRSGWAFFVLMA